jgi:hypothetical protein
VKASTVSVDGRTVGAPQGAFEGTLSPDGQSQHLDGDEHEAQGKVMVKPVVVAFEQAMPAAHVVRLAHANHCVFRSNEPDVLREMNAFIAGLPPAP